MCSIDKKKSKSRILCVMPMFSGLIPYLHGLSDMPCGMPPVYKLLEALALSSQFTVKLIMPYDKRLYSEKKVRCQVFGTIQLVLIPVKFDNCIKFLTKYHIPNPKIFGIARNLVYLAYILYHAIKFKPNVIYASQELVLPAWVVSKILRCKIISRFYGTLLHEIFLSRNITNIEKNNLYVIHNGILNPSKIKLIDLWITNTFENICLKLPTDQIIMTNDGTRGLDLLRRLGVPEYRIKFWLNGVDQDLMNDDLNKMFDTRSVILKKLNMPDDALLILTISRLAYWKRVDRIITALPNIIERVPNVFCLIIGDGAELKNLYYLSQKLGVSKRVKFLGRVPHDDIKDYLGVCDLFVSLYFFSNLCNPVLEAMTVGLPVVSISDGSLNGIIENQQTGILINPSRLSKDLPLVISKVLLNPDEMIRIARNTKNFAQSHFVSWEERINREIDLLRQLVPFFILFFFSPLLCF